MNCPQARFLLYAHFDRELAPGDAEALSRHLAVCAPCRTRADSARGLARVLHSRTGRALAPNRLRSRLQMLPFAPVRPRTASYFLAAAMTLLIVPLVADGPAPRPEAEAPEHFTEAMATAAVATPIAFVSTPTVPYSELVVPFVLSGIGMAMYAHLHPRLSLQRLSFRGDIIAATTGRDHRGRSAVVDLLKINDQDLKFLKSLRIKIDEDVA